MGSNEKRTPMAWQHRDMNYHQAGYQDRYGNNLDMVTSMRPGPPSTSDRISHRTDKSWRTQKDSQAAYPVSRPSYSNGRLPSRTHSPTTSGSSSSTDSDPEHDDQPSTVPPFHQQSVYGYYPGYPPSAMMGYPPSVSQYPGTMKSAKSVPSFVGTWDGEPCPVHGGGPMSLPGPMPPHLPHPMVIPGAMTLPPKRAASIYDIRMMGPPPGPPIYHTLPPPRPMPGDRRSIALPPRAPPGIPSQFLPPMARPRPLVVSEQGTTEPLPMRSPQDKLRKEGLGMTTKADLLDGAEKHRIVCPGGVCVAMIVMGVISAGLLLGALLIFIL